MRGCVCIMCCARGKRTAAAMVERGVRGRVRRDMPGERGEVAPKPLSFPPNPHAAPLPPRSGVPSRGLCFGILSPDIVRGVGGWTRPNDRGEKRRLDMDPVEERRDRLFSVFAPARSCHGESGWPSPAPRSSSSSTMSSVRRGRPAKLFLLRVVMVTEASPGSKFKFNGFWIHDQRQH